MQESARLVPRFYSLDALRGIAALSVVFWHWQHFFFVGATLGAYDVSRAPLAGFLFPLYTKGLLAVNLFFGLSGFIFYRLYSECILRKEISPKTFFWLRFSRLYPLHFVTLLIVAGSQTLFKRETGSFFVCPYNDVKHFILNLFFASSWGLEDGSSFNAPIWSVSVEVLLYVFFFACCRLLPIRVILLVSLSIFGFVIERKVYVPIGQGIGSFFLGGCAFLIYQTVIASAKSRLITRWLTYVTAGIWIATILAPSLHEIFTAIGEPVVILLSPLERFVQVGLQKTMWRIVVLFPLTILALALNETHRGSLGKRFAFLGDISYSSYLIHFPLQVLSSLIVARLALDRSIFYSPLFMGLFFAVLVLTSLASHHYFEMPTQRFMRYWSLHRTGMPTAPG